MEYPKKALVIIEWEDEDGIKQKQEYKEDNLEAAADLLLLMIGGLSDEDMES